MAFDIKELKLPITNFDRSVNEIRSQLVEYAKQPQYGDIEAKGFYDDVHTKDDVWCLCTITDDNTILLFHDYPEFDFAEVYDEHDEKHYRIPPRVGSLEEGIRFWSYTTCVAGGSLSIHNAKAYDEWICEKIFPQYPIRTTRVRDTFNQSKIQWADRPTPLGAKSGHGLKGYGIMFGIKKPDIDDWTTMDAYKLHRVIEDVKIQRAVQKFLDEEARILATLGVSFEECTLHEDLYAWNSTQQEINGAPLDEEHVLRMIEMWDENIEKIRAEVEPQLPPVAKPASAQKVSRSECMQLLEDDIVRIYGKMLRIPPDEMETVTRAGVTKTQAKKIYSKPTTRYTKTLKSNIYSASTTIFPDEKVYSPEFTKAKDCRDWIKENYPEYPPKVWDIKKEERTKEILNNNTAEWFSYDKNSDIISGSFTRVVFEKSTMTQHDVVKAMLIKSGIQYCEEWNLKKDSDGKIERAKSFMVVSYPPKAAPENQMHKKIKKGEPIVTTPKFTEKTYKQLGDNSIGKQIAEYNTTMHRRRFFQNPEDPAKGILATKRPDGRIPCGVNNFATATGRAAHRNWVNAAGAGALYGLETRAAIALPEDSGRILVSCDMASAQLQIAAYYAQNWEYMEAVASGQEFDDNHKYVGGSAHCFGARAFGLVSEEEWKEAVETQNKELIESITLRRKKSKGLSFGTLFGASGKKVALMMGEAEEVGQKARDLFLDRLGIGAVIDWAGDLKNVYKRGRGWYIPMPMGYWVYCDGPHKALNYLIQGTEAVAQKIAINWINAKVKEEGLDAVQILDYHK
ncbi:DNA polymerase [Pseudoalteromonas phage J2-1_QLiu-2017]|nr:DNA polymerase [Pseudoalteromonas phage J2-1_QLiu-2017]